MRSQITWFKSKKSLEVVTLYSRLRSRKPPVPAELAGTEGSTLTPQNTRAILPKGIVGLAYQTIYNLLIFNGKLIKLQLS